MRNCWTRPLWAIRFKSKSDAFLIGTAWAKERNAFPCHPEEPSRALLFLKRRQALAWCAVRNAEYKSRSEGDICRVWRFTPVRVTESIVPT